MIDGIDAPFGLGTAVEALFFAPVLNTVPWELAFNEEDGH